MNLTLQDIIKVFHENSYWENTDWNDKEKRFTGRIKLVNKNEAAKKIIQLINENYGNNKQKNKMD